MQLAFATVPSRRRTRRRRPCRRGDAVLEIDVWRWPIGSRHQRHGVPATTQQSGGNPAARHGPTSVRGQSLSSSVANLLISLTARLDGVGRSLLSGALHDQTCAMIVDQRAGLRRLDALLDTAILRAQIAPVADDTVRTSARSPRRRVARSSRVPERASGSPSWSAPPSISSRRCSTRPAGNPGEPSGARQAGRDLALVQRVHRGLGLFLGPHGRHRLAGAVDAPGQLVGPLDACDRRSRRRPGSRSGRSSRRRSRRSPPTGPPRRRRRRCPRRPGRAALSSWSPGSVAWGGTGGSTLRRGPRVASQCVVARNSAVSV